MSALLQDIREIIAQDGPISLERYMTMALTDPRHGYYTTREPFGVAGDFITAPEISQMFGELIGLWAAEVWRSMGAPASCRLVELGPGRGTLMADALNAARVVAPFYKALSVHLVDASPRLAQRQRVTLARFDCEKHWHERIEDVPGGPAIIIANEFFDALPVRHYVFAQGGWRERLVGLSADEGLMFGLAPYADGAIHGAANEGAVLEIGVAAHRVMSDLAARLVAQGGALLAVDYGHMQTALGETLQALHHGRPADPLAAPGEADLTAHVDFASLARAARAAGADVHGPVTQADFLLAIGLRERASGLKRRATPQQAQDIDAALARLSDVSLQPNAAGVPTPGMGALFKAIAVTQPGLPTPPGFSSHEAPT